MLQPLLLPGKDGNPFSVHISSEDENTLHVYFGLALLEKVKGKDGFQYKYLLARLYNSGYERKILHDTFGHALDTLRRWGDAVITGDANVIVRAFSGKGAQKVMTEEIEKFVRSEFGRIFPTDKYTYSKTIKCRVEEVFKVHFSSERLRKIFTSEKKLMEGEYARKEGLHEESDKANACECFENLSSPEEENRNNSLSNLENMKVTSEKVFLHHIGIVLVFGLLNDMKFGHQIIEQWICSILLGKVNLEQTESLNYDALDFLLGFQAIRKAKTQHTILRHLATDNESRIKMLQLNAEYVNGRNYEYFYYDPHSIKYTGMKNILKGWCGSSGKITKVNYQDFFHTPNGFPIYFEIHDNLIDMRERFIKSVDFFSKEIINSEGKTFIIDRGIYGREKMIKISERGYGLVTWEKSYKRDAWNENGNIIELKIERPKNCSTDIKTWSVKFIRDNSFSKIPGFYRLIVKILPPGKNRKEAEVSVLTNGKINDTTAVRSMLNRWVQENDFRYMVINFGLNQITSYESEDYNDMMDTIAEKKVMSESYKVIREAVTSIKTKLGKELVKILSDKENEAISMNPSASILKKELSDLEKEMNEVEMYENKIEKLIRENASKLSTDKKAMLDAVKILSRNIFFSMLKIFRPIYNNYRNDHKILRELICSHGYFSAEEKRLTFQINLERRLSPEQKRKIEHFICSIENNINEKNIFRKNVSLTIH